MIAKNSGTTDRVRAATRVRSLHTRTALTEREQQTELERDAKRYDRDYFDRWYRDPRHQVRTAESLGRTVRMTVGIAEFILARPIRSVLDIGCGEGAWFPILRRLRPTVRYLGLDPSPYVVRRYGTRRHIRPGAFGDLAHLGVRRTFDLIVCADVLQYVPADELARGLGEIRRAVRGLAYVEAFAEEDRMEGDRAGWHDRPAKWYRRVFKEAGLVQCGPHCYLDLEKFDNLNALEHM
jgi:SAM-dependent methyltransferase